jgi:hypothetical protein
MSGFNYFDISINYNENIQNTIYIEGLGHCMIEDSAMTMERMNREQKKEQTAGCTEEFIEKIYDLFLSEFKEKIFKNCLPEVPKLPIPKNIYFPVKTDIVREFNPMVPPKLVRVTHIIHDNFEDWLYHYRYMLQYYTAAEMFNIYEFNVNPFGDVYDEPNAWVDKALENMYISSEDDTENTAEKVEEFEFNLEWDIEKGTLGHSNLSLRFTEEVGMREDESDDEK